LSEREVPIAVLASGSGTNFQALLDADLGPGKIVLLLSNQPDAKALDRAKRANVPAAVIDHREHASREEFDRAVVDRLRRAHAEWIVFAGFMRVVTRVLLDAFPGRIVNIHPALLPAFPGVNAQKQAFDAGVKIAGCTVHLVDPGVDTGPILAQAAVPVLPTDDLDALRHRILAQEHRLFPAVVRALAEGRLTQDARGRPVLAGFEAALLG
jgi:phosphoribosylglycinamide formyltransferase 1